MLTEINWYIDEQTCPIPVQNGVFNKDIIILKIEAQILLDVVLNADHSNLSIPSNKF